MGKNKVIINPKVGEQAEVTTKPSAEDKKQIEMKKRMLQKKMMLQKQAMQMQKQGKLALNYNEETGKVCPKCGKSPCECEKKDADPRGNYAMMNVTRNKLRAMGLKMSYDMEGESIDEVTYPSDFIDKRTGKKKAVATSKTGRPQQHDQPMSGGRRKTVDESAEDRLRDQRQERGGVDGNARYDRAPKAPNTKKFGTGKTMAQKEMEKKYGKGATAMDIVCLLYTSPSPRDRTRSRMPSSA